MCVQKEMHFDDELVLRQIKYSGMLEMVRIQKAGFGAKYTFEVWFHKCYRPDMWTHFSYKYRFSIQRMV